MNADDRCDARCARRSSPYGGWAARPSATSRGYADPVIPTGDPAPTTPATVERLAAIGLAGGRIAIGAAIWLTPALAARALGFESFDRKQLVLGRIAGTRDLILGSWQLAAIQSRTGLRRASAATALADAGDALTFALALLDGGGSAAAARRGLAGALPATLAGAWLVARLRNPAPQPAERIYILVERT